MKQSLADRYHIVIDHPSGAKLTVDGKWQRLDFPSTMSDDEVPEIQQWAERVYSDLKVTEALAKGATSD